ncbi:50S ribosomal protein L5 [Candidatus Saccharibacteria bacterium]|jgi:large subunit ribosomal protein L5|nr:50S ribosomal protein L5 [Candidatus Saccharibacteria bacterium]
MSKDTSVATTPRLKKQFQETLAAQLKESLKLSNIHQVPQLDKIVINVGLGRSKDDKRMFEIVRTTLRKITGQHPVEIIAKKSIASFKIRAGMNTIGMKVTLRGDKMYEFLDRLTNIVLPRVRDFHGVSKKAFDPQGNYSLGLTEQSVFPELTFEDISQLHGLQVNFTIVNSDKVKSRALLEGFGIPFEKDGR